MVIIQVDSVLKWGSQGVCAETEDDRFFPVEDHKILPEHAKIISNLYCNRCPVLKQCRQFAIASDPDVGGIWAGTTPRERNKIRKTLESQGVHYQVTIETDPEIFAPEPYSVFIAQLIAEDQKLNSLSIL